MDIENDYYHGLAGSLVTSSIKENVEVSLKQLESIISYGGLFSKKIREKYKITFDSKPVYNDDDFISVCVKNFDEKELHGINEGLDSAYNKYVENKLSIVIKKEIENTSDFRTGDYDKLPGERQIKDIVSITDFRAIRVGYENDTLNEIVCNEVKNILDKYGFLIPVLDKNNNIVFNNERKF